MMQSRTFSIMLLATTFLVCATSHAAGPGSDARADKDAAPSQDAATRQDASEQNAEDPKLTRARELFKKGVKGVKKAAWADALSAFERSDALRPHATTTFNIGACERAMGRYTRAREDFKKALARNDSHPGELAQSLASEAHAIVQEIDRLVAHVDMTLDPPSAAIAVDGRPLSAVKRQSGTVWVGGLGQPGRGRAIGKRSFHMELDPGVHVITLTRKGYTDQVVNRSFSPGSTTKLDLELAHLPARIVVSSNVRGAIVTVDRRDFGPAPVTVLRPAGSYRVVVTKKGYAPYEAQVAVKAGEESKLKARLAVQKTPITKRWWFWTGAAAVVAGGALATYALTRPEPSPPPYDGGSTGWVVHPTALSF